MKVNEVVEDLETLCSVSPQWQGVFANAVNALRNLEAEKAAMWKALSPFCMNVTRYQKTRYCNYGEAEVYVVCTQRNCPLLKDKV